MAKVKNGKISMTFSLTSEEMLPLRINAVGDGVKPSVIFNKLILNSYEYKNCYLPIRDISPIPQLSRKKVSDGVRQTHIVCDPSLKTKIQIMALINDTTMAEIIRYIVVKYSPKLPSQNNLSQ